MIRLGIIGIHGRMGQVIAAEASKQKDVFTLVGGIGKGETVSKILEADVFIDFSHVSGTLENLPLIVENGKALVIGTTGFSESDKNDVKNLASKIPCVL